MNKTTRIKPPAKLNIKEQWKVKAKAEKAPALSKNLGVDLWRFPRAGAVLLMHISSNSSAWIWSLDSGLWQTVTMQNSWAIQCESFVREFNVLKLLDLGVGAVVRIFLSKLLICVFLPKDLKYLISRCPWGRFFLLSNLKEPWSGFHWEVFLQVFLWIWASRNPFFQLPFFHSLHCGTLWEQTDTNYNSAQEMRAFRNMSFLF